MTQSNSSDTGGTAGRRSRKARFVIAAVVLVGVGAAVGALAKEAPVGWAGWGGWHHRGEVSTQAEAIERVQKLSAWALGSVDATDDQRTQVDEVLASLVEHAYPLKQQHRENRQDLIAELARPEVSREALEDLRTRELAIVEALSAELVDSVVEIAGILDAEQRAALTERLARHHH